MEEQLTQPAQQLMQQPAQQPAFVTEEQLRRMKVKELVAKLERIKGVAIPAKDKRKNMLISQILSFQRES